MAIRSTLDAQAVLLQHSWAAFWDSLPGLLWVLLAIVFVSTFRKGITAVFRSLVGRVQAGAQMKLGVIEVGAYRVPYKSDHPLTGRLINVVSGYPKEEQLRAEDLQGRYEQHRYFFLVHTLAPSQDSNPGFDVVIYVTPHYGSGATLMEIDKVQYYLGEAWGGKIYESVHRASGFAMATGAYGSFLVTAKVFFHDGTDTVISDYIDLRSASLEPRAGQLEV